MEKANLLKTKDKYFIQGAREEHLLGEETSTNYLSKTIKKIVEEKKKRLDSFLEDLYNTL